MRTIPALLVAVASVVAGACSSPGDELDSAATTTTEPDRPTTTDDRPEEPDSPEDPDPEIDPGEEGDPCAEPPVWAWRGQPGDEDCVTPPTTEAEPQPGPDPEPELGTGDVQITLRWTSSADLDLHVVEPSGTEIAFDNPGPTATGGQLDVDSNVGCEQEASVENVFWPEGDMPLGDYRVVVHGYEVEGCGGGEYTLTATVKGQPVLDESGAVLQDENDEFTFVAA